MKFRLQKIFKPIAFFFASIMRPAFGYKYKIVYTELEVNGSFKKRFIAKFKMEDGNDRILERLPKVNGCHYIAPFVLMYSKTEKGLNTRIQLRHKDHPQIAARAYF